MSTYPSGDRPVALSILQPWAYLVAAGFKPVENRRWKTSRRGPFYIHAGKRWGSEQRQDLAYVRRRFPHLELPSQYDLGGIVGEGTLEGCLSVGDAIPDDVLPWFAGPHGLLVRNARVLKFAPCRGQLGWFSVPEEVLRLALDDGTHATSTRRDSHPPH